MRAGAEAPLRAAVVMVVAVLIVLPGCGGGSGQPVSPGSSPPSAVGPAAPTSATTSGSGPHTRPPGAVPGALADPPPTVGQLCTPGYTRTVRPPVAYTDALKRRQLVDFGYADRDPTHYEEDHLVPLSIGGAPRDERNLWPQPWPEAKDKDREEDALHVGVCTHRMSLAEALRKILADWGPG